MAVPVEGFSVLVRNVTLEQIHPGGLSGYAEACPNQTFCTDGHISRIGFMNALDLANFLDQLHEYGLSSAAEDPNRDITVVCQEDGLDSPCDWLQLGRHSSGVVAAWLAGRKPGEIVGPEGWTPAPSITQVSKVEARKRLKFLRIDGPIDIFFDTETEKEVYVGRTNLLPDEDSHDDFPGRSASDLYDWGTALANPYLPFQRSPLDPTTKTAQQELCRAVRLLTASIQLNSKNWAACWILGLTFRMRGQHESEYKALGRAYRLNPEHKDVLREFCLSCMTLGYGEEAVQVGWQATELDPRDAGLLSNLGLALLVSGEVIQAERVVQRALHMQPNDAITQNLLGYVQDVASGKKPRPTCFPPT
ncbi:tetratricopeptide repeat protein [Thalassoroseus pseudoceratinae]|uniref:tetratricopeptide repeat protein n=1 Tax=Thalassoroseus pseudoceratinae TaxID=2713176 RepID=UPI0014232E94|nr:tetratricopeptide repeat protein [Thalassoroseus pseudoceratinae]